MTCEDFEELSGAYALGSLTSEERRAVEAHVAECPACTLKLQELQSVANLLPLTVPDVEPPADMKARFFAQLQQEGAAKTARSQRPPVVQRPRRNRWRLGLLAVAAIFVCMLLGGMTIWNISLQQQVAQLSTNTVQSSSYALQGLSDHANARGQLTCYSKPNVCTVVVYGLSQTTGNHVYQGWLLHGKQLTSVGLFTIKNGTATLDFQETISGYDTVAISLEPGPAASKDAPRGPVIAAGAL